MMLCCRHNVSLSLQTVLTVHVFKCLSDVLQYHIVLIIVIFFFQLFICQYHIWLAADTKGILVLIPGTPMLNIIVSTFIFVCVAHEISQITNDLAQIVVPKDNVMLLKRLIWASVFLSGFLFLSSFQK